MTAMANMGNLVVALPPSDIWLTDEQAADFLGYANTYFKASIICLKGFPKPRYIMANSKGRRWNLKMLSDWLSERPDDLKIKTGRPRKIQRGFSCLKYGLRQIYAKVHISYCFYSVYWCAQRALSEI